jgi:hypothetical protein
MVRARSAAEMPVVTPSRASIEVVKAVSWRVPLCGSSATAELVDSRLGEREADQAAAMLGHEVDRVGRRHLRGMTRSPSFSRSSSSTRMNMRPLRASSMICSALAITPRRRCEEALELEQVSAGRVPVGLAEPAQDCWREGPQRGLGPLGSSRREVHHLSHAVDQGQYLMPYLITM